MPFKNFPDQQQSTKLLQRSLERGRLGHAYLFVGGQLDELEGLASTLAKTLSCLHPTKKAGMAIDCCDQCVQCQKIDHGNHADVHWVRPESKSRVITIEQMRDLMQVINLKPTEGGYKFGIIVAADRLNVQAANAFLKTLEEPPPKSVLVLLSTEPQRLLETILSRCLRLNFGGNGSRPLSAAEMAWLTQFSEMAAAEQKSLLGRYRLMDVLLRKLNEIKSATEEALTARSPLQRYPDVEKELQDKWEDELKAAIEAEYRRQRADLLLVLERWLRDVWVESIQDSNSTIQKPKPSNPEAELLNFPAVAATKRVASRITGRQGAENLEIMEQLHSFLGTNVQEALALEVGLLKLRL
jgi:DNA polymerase-3 subunit delta'